MNRRDFIKTLGAVASVVSMPSLVHASTSSTANNNYLLMINAYGGWDVTSYCDPKENVAGQPMITQWSTTQKTQKVGNISYAPIANNAEFFNKHYQKMCVINGFDVATFGHGSGRRVNASGRLIASHPSIAALFASTHQNLPLMPYLAGGDYTNTVGLVSAVAMSNSFHSNLKRAAYPELNPNGRYEHWNGWRNIGKNDQALMSASLKKRLTMMSNDTSLLNQDKALVDKMLNFETESQSFSDFYTTYQSLPKPPYGYVSLPVIMAAFASNQTIAADVKIGGFDSHVDNDASQEIQFTRLNDAIDYIWQLADLLGISDKLTLIVNSDFSRTPQYNRTNGKDHHNIGSSIVMQNNPSWGNRVVGSTTSAHQPHKYNLATMTRDDTNGEVLTVQHVHLAYRDLLGLTNTPNADRYNFGGLIVPNIFS